MEWIEVTGKTVEEAKEAALDELGVDESDAEFEVVAEPKAGLFGLLRAEARVRARVMPTRARPKVERRGRRPAGRKERTASDAARPTEPRSAEPRSTEPRSDERRPDERRTDERRTDEKRGDERPAEAGNRPRRNRGGERSAVRPERPASRARAEQEGEPMSDDTETREAAVAVAEEFLAGVSTRFSDQFEVAHRELPEDIVEVAVTGEDLGLLIGPRGQTLASLQELTRTVVQRRVPTARTRIMVDVAGYREARREALERFTQGVCAEVKESGEPRELEPMSAADRKVVHDTANGIDGVATASEGEDPQRRVVILPTTGAGSDGGSDDDGGDRDDDAG